MGGGLPRFVPKFIRKPVNKVVKAGRKVAAEVFEEVIEKPYKKVADETFDVVMGTNKEERRAMLYGEQQSAGEPEVTPEVTPEVVPDDTVLGRGRRRSKRSGQAGTIMEEYGALTAKAKAKAVEKA